MALKGMAMINSPPIAAVRHSASLAGNPCPQKRANIHTTGNAIEALNKASSIGGIVATSTLLNGSDIANAVAVSSRSPQFVSVIAVPAWPSERPCRQD
jgi:hypothetical protein